MRNIRDIKKRVRIKHTRLANLIDINLYNLMAELEVSHTTLYNWLSGRTTPSLRYILGISRFLDVDLERLIEMFIKIKDGEIVVEGKRGKRTARKNEALRNIERVKRTRSKNNK